MPDAPVPVAPLPSTSVPPQATAAANAVEAAPAEAKAPKAKPEAPEDFLELTVDGKPEKVARSEAIKRLQKAAFADKVTQQAREALKTVNEQRAKWEAEKAEQQKMLEEDEEAYLKKMGRDPEALARKILERKLRESELTPEQREAEAAKAELAQLKKQQAEQAAQSEKAQVEAQAKHIEQLMSDELSKAADAVGLPKSGRALEVMHALVKESFDAGFPVDSEWAPRIAEEAKLRIEEAFAHTTKAALDGLDGDALEKRLGPEVVEKLLAHRLAKLRGKRSAPASIVPDAPAPKANPYITVAEANAQMRKLRGA